jgi:hypothetical protein
MEDQEALILNALRIYQGGTGSSANQGDAKKFAKALYTVLQKYNWP